MTKTAEKLLKRIGKTEEASIRLTKRDVRAANELQLLGLTEFIPLAVGGADICLTKDGVTMYESYNVG